MCQAAKLFFGPCSIEIIKTNENEREQDEASSEHNFPRSLRAGERILGSLPTVVVVSLCLMVSQQIAIVTQHVNDRLNKLKAFFMEESG